MTTTNNYKRGLGALKNRDNLENALHKLKASGYDLERVSVITRENRSAIDSDDVETKKIGDHKEEGAATGAVTGGVLGTATGLLVGLGVLAIPGIGPILLAGAEATAIGAAAGGLVGGSIGLGIPEEKAKFYNDLVSDGYYLLIITDTAESVSRAEIVLRDYEVENWEVYDAPQTSLNSGATVAATETTDLETEANGEEIKVSPEVIIVDRRN